jgi:hypothetical protein
MNTNIMYNMHGLSHSGRFSYKRVDKNFFCSDFLFLRSKKCFPWSCKTSDYFSIKFAQVSLEAKIQATSLASLHGKKYIYPKWCGIAICNLYQLLVCSLEILSWFIRHFSSDLLPSLTAKSAEVLKIKIYPLELEISSIEDRKTCVID